MYRSASLEDITQQELILRRKLEKFHINHHDATRISFKNHMRKWENDIKDGLRCQTCWLRVPYDCYCQDIKEKRLNVYDDYFNNHTLRVKILMYYHYQEIGRSPNTGHIFEALCPSHCDNLLFVDSDNEIKLMNSILQDIVNGDNSYCVMYPTASAITLNEWLNNRKTNNPQKPVTLIALDGTYSHAMRQWKHLVKLAAVYNISVPVVKLDLGDDGCESAIAGVMLVLIAY